MSILLVNTYNIEFPRRWKYKANFDINLSTDRAHYASSIWLCWLLSRCYSCHPVGCNNSAPPLSPKGNGIKLREKFSPFSKEWQGRMLAILWQIPQSPLVDGGLWLSVPYYLLNVILPKGERELNSNALPNFLSPFWGGVKEGGWTVPVDFDSPVPFSTCYPVFALLPLSPRTKQGS